MRVGSLFSGIGGLELGFERAGFEIAWQVEIDPWCRKVLAKHWPLVPKYEDIRDVGANELEWVDVIVGGFPCQDISGLGPGQALSGARSGLWFEFARIIEECKPTYAVIENVSALLFRGLPQVVQSLSTMGYDVEWRVVSAFEVGAPQIRERLFIVAHANGIRRNDTQVQEGIYSQEPRQSSELWLEHEIAISPNGSLWCIPKSRVHGVANGFSRRLDRLRVKGLGNAVVPQVAQYVAECVKAHAEAQDILRRKVVIRNE